MRSRNTDSKQEDGDTGFDGHVGQDICRFAGPPHLKGEILATASENKIWSTAYLHGFDEIVWLDILEMTTGTIVNTSDFVRDENDKHELRTVSDATITEWMAHTCAITANQSSSAKALMTKARQ